MKANRWARPPAILTSPNLSLRKWVEQARTDRGTGKPGVLTTSEREELGRLRKEVRELRMERDVLKKATAFFAKDHL
jgi:transposase